MTLVVTIAIFLVLRKLTKEDRNTTIINFNIAFDISIHKSGV